ncbi:MAG: GTPase Era [Gemmatimonadaceae bacterium]
MTRAGIVTVVGKPNAGKSTFLNRVVGQKLSIVSPKPQSTRDRIVGILTDAETQMIVFDTPGLLNPRYELHRAMRATALDALADADVVIYLADVGAGAAPPLIEAAELKSPPTAPILTVYNKVDTIDAGERERLLHATPDARFVSALTGDGIDTLLAEARALLPDSPFLYDAEDISTQSVRFFAAELIRESALEQLDDEVPYSLACEIEEFRETRTPVYIRAVLYLERETQKHILIGAKGARIKEIGRVARMKIEGLIDQKVYLDLWVKVLPNWRKNANAMARFGYRIPQEKKSR